MLYKLGQFCYDKKWWVVAVWVSLLLIAGGIAGTNARTLSDAITIPGTEAQKTLDDMADAFPAAGKGSGRVVLRTKQPKNIEAYNGDIKTLAGHLSDISGVKTVITPQQDPGAISKDKRVAYLTLQLANTQGNVDESLIKDVERTIEDFRSEHKNLQVESSGDIIKTVPGEILGVGEIGGVVVALIVLLITLGALLPAGLPLAVAFIAVGIGVALLFIISQWVDITSTTPVLSVMLGLAVGIDYSLFIITKYKTYLFEGYDERTAIAKTIATAGNAVVFAALTVVIALSALSVVNIPFMTTMGVAGAGTIALAALVAITFLPAVAGFVGNKFIPKRQRRKIPRTDAQIAVARKTPIHKSTIWYKWGNWMAHHPWISIAGVVVIVGVLAWPVGKLQMGLPTDQYAARDTTQRRAYDMLSQAFGEGFNGPLLVMVRGLEPVSDSEVAKVRKQAMAQYDAQVYAATKTATAQIQQQLAQASSVEEQMAIQQQALVMQKQAEIQKKQALAKIDMQIAQYKKYAHAATVADRLAKHDGVKQAQPALVSDDGKTALIQVVSKTGPSSQDTLNVIQDIRDKKGDLAKINQQLAVTGSTALEADINAKLAAALPVYLAVVVGLSLLLLVVAFRSILIPIKATLGFLLSVGAMFGVIVGIFQLGWFGIASAPGPIVSFVPIIGIGVLFGLAMDYEFFMVSGMHEAYARKKDAKHAVVDGFSAGAKVVTAAALIMTAVFAAFIFNSDKTIQSIGFGLAVGVAVDAFLVRMVLVPSVMQLLGRSAWWLPKWLDRLVPHISIEGNDK